MDFFFLPKEKTREIDFFQTDILLLYSLLLAWITVFGLSILASIPIDIFSENRSADAGQGIGIALGAAIIPMFISYPLSLVVAQ